jgi:two-component system NarL family response regulator
MNDNRERSKDPIRVLIADDHPVVLEGLASIILQERDMAVVAKCNNGREAVEQYRIHRPDVALLDLRMPSMDGTEAISTIRQEFRNARFIILTTYDSDEDIYQGLRAGAMAYMLKGSPPDELIGAIRAAHSGRKQIPQDMVERLTDRMGSPELTTRELEVLRLVTEGKSNKEIAAELGIEVGTARAHCNNLFQKLDVNDRTSAAVLALQRGLVRLDKRTH